MVPSVQTKLADRAFSCETEADSLNLRPSRPWDLMATTFSPNRDSLEWMVDSQYTQNPSHIFFQSKKYILKN